MGLKVRRVRTRLIFFLKLKSDQNGIESPISKFLMVFSMQVEIRPKWDWKVSSTALTIESSIWLKSDQNGIERRERAWMNVSNNTSWNQTKMGLKVSNIADSISVETLVEIRPKWDWKPVILTESIAFISELKSDQEETKSINPREQILYNK